MKPLLFFFIFLFLGTLSFAQNLTVRGFVYDQANGEPMAYEKVKILKLDSSITAGAITDLNGFFQIPKLKRDKYILKISNQKYETSYKNIDFNNGKSIIDVKFELRISEGFQEFDEVRVSAESRTKRTQIEISKLKLSKEGLERIPSYGAENDIVGAFSVTPGVITTGDQGGQLYVRGGTPIQNKILLDGMTIYNPFHSIGFFSIFETELVKNVDIYTGGFEAKYGGRISSVWTLLIEMGTGRNLPVKYQRHHF